MKDAFYALQKTRVNLKLLISAFRLCYFLQNKIINILTKPPFKLQHNLCFEIMKGQFHNPEPNDNPEVQGLLFNRVLLSYDTCKRQGFFGAQYQHYLRVDCTYICYKNIYLYLFSCNLMRNNAKILKQKIYSPVTVGFISNRVSFKIISPLFLHFSIQLQLKQYYKLV